MPSLTRTPSYIYTMLVKETVKGGRALLRSCPLRAALLSHIPKLFKKPEKQRIGAINCHVVEFRGGHRRNRQK